MDIRVVYVNLLLQSFVNKELTNIVSVSISVDVVSYNSTYLWKIFVYIDIQLVWYAICVTVMMIMRMVSSLLYNTYNFILLLNPTQNLKL